MRDGLFGGVVRCPFATPRQPLGADYDDLCLCPRARSRDDGTDTLQNQRMRLSAAAAYIHQDIITGTVMQRAGMNCLLEIIRAGDVLVVTALDRLGRDTLGLLELINRLATMGVDLKVLDMPVARPGRGRRRSAHPDQQVQVERQRSVVTIPSC